MDVSPRKRYSTVEVPPTLQFAYWRESICEAFAALDPVAAAGARAAFPSLVEVDFLPGARLSLVDSLAQKVVRAAPQIRRDPQDRLFVNFQLVGESRVEQGDGRRCIGPGDAYVVDTSRPYVLDHPQPFRLLCLAVPRDMLIGTTRRPLAFATPRSMTQGRMRLAGLLVRELRQPTALGLAEDRAEALAVACRWLSACFTEAPGPVADRAVAARRDAWRRARALILDGLPEPDLGPARLAAELGISLRYLHQAFAQQGTTVAATIRNERLARCAESLLRWRGRRTIASIAQDCGFSDVPNFNRLFRRRFGCAPKAYGAP